MTSVRRHTLLSLFAITACCLMLMCGGGTEIGTGRTELTAGILYFSEGKPAAGATVRFVPATELEKPVIRTLLKSKNREYYALTGSDGRIVLNDTLEDGYYNAFGGAGTLISYHDSILFSNGSCPLISDTLRAPGSLSGQLALRSEYDYTSVLIIVPGFPTILPDKNGFFTLSDFPQGSYYVRFLSTLDSYRVYDTVITITAGNDDTLRSPITLPYVGFVPIEGLYYTMDTLNRSVTFTWNKVNDSHISGYRIELAVDNLPTRYEKVISNVADTQFTYFLQDSVKFRVRTLNIDNDPWGSYSERICVCAYNLSPIKQITASSDSIYATDLAAGPQERLDLFVTDRFHQQSHSIRQIDTSGKLLHTFFFDTSTTPIAFSLAGDTTVVLFRQNSDTLSAHWLLNDLDVKLIPGITITAETDMPVSLGCAPSGDLFISTSTTLYRVDPSGTVLLMKNRMSRSFSIVNNLIFTIPTASPYEVIGMNDLFEQESSYPYGTDTSFITSDVSVNVCTFTANKNGWFCSLIDKSMFVFNGRGNQVARLYLNRGNSVTDMVLSDSDILYILYTDTGMDAIDLTPIRVRFGLSQ